MKKITLFLIIMLLVTQSSFVFAMEVKPITPVDPEVKSNITDGLNQPYGLSTDYLGNIYVADTYNNMIKKITAEGLEIVAGGFDIKGNMGFPKGRLVDGKALEARFNQPRDIYITNSGVIYVADTGNNVIRKIEAGYVSTISGNGKPGFTDGMANVAQFNLPSALTMDSEGKLYVADTLNNSIRVISKDGSVQTLSFMPDGQTLTSGALNEPSDILFDDKGVLYILDSGNQSIKRVQDGVISLVAGTVNDVNINTGYVNAGLVDGVGNEAKFNFPKGFAMDGKGNLFVADSWNHVIRVITPEGEVHTFSGEPFKGNIDGDIKTARYDIPTGIIVNNGVLVISDMWNNEIKEIQIDYNDMHFGNSDWMFWDDHNEVVLDKPIINEGNVYLMPFKSTMMYYGYDVSWDAVNRRVLYSNGNVNGFIDDSSGMKVFQSRSYLSTVELGKIIHRELKVLITYKTIMEIDQ